MNIFKLSYRNMTSRPLSTTLSLILLTVGVGMISLIMQVHSHIQQQMENNVRGIDMVVGAKGSPLQLILSAVYHIDAPTGNIDLHEAEQLQNNRLVAKGIPLSYGDSYKGYRIVGSNHDYPNLYEAVLSEGRLWRKPSEVVIGATVASDLNMQIGDTFSGAHGLAEGGEVHEGHVYKVVGIVRYNQSVLDQLILTATESVWEVHDHDHNSEPEDNDHHNGQDEHHSDEVEHEITAMLIQFQNPLAMVQLPRMVNENTNMQAAVPSYEISRLFSLMGLGVDTLSTFALVIMALSGLSVFISLFNALKDHKYEMALMRCYGANRWQLVWLVSQEGLLLTFLGFLQGIFFSRIGLVIISGLLKAEYHYSFSAWTWLPEEWWLLVTALTIGFLASIIPAIRAFYINISKTLAYA